MGSIVALVLGMFLLQYVHVSTLFMLSLLITVIAVKQINEYEKEVGEHDSKEIVIDELAGMWLALSICGMNVQDTNHFLIMSGLAFVYFRLFDIWKPSIIGRIDEKVEGGWGVMGDDLVAGLAAGVATAGTYQILIKFIF